MRILITGGSGFVGRYLAEALAEHGHTPVVLYNANRPQWAGIAVQGDIADLDQMQRILEQEKINRVIHAAALLVLPTQEDPHRGFRVNVQGTVNILEAARRLALERVVFVSSQGVYGSTTMRAIPEDAPKNPAWLYGAQKLVCEDLGLVYASQYQVDFVALRLPYVYGFHPNAPPGQGTIPRLVEAAALGTPVRVGGGSQRYGILYVRDAVAALIRATVAEVTGPRVFNIGADEALTLEEMVAIIGRYVRGFQAEIKPGRHRFISTDGYLDSTLAKKHLGYAPAYPFERAVQEYLQYLGHRTGGDLAAPKFTE